MTLAAVNYATPVGVKPKVKTSWIRAKTVDALSSCS